MQGSINQNDVEHAFGRVSRDVSNNTFHGQIPPVCGSYEVPNAIGREIHSDDSVALLCDEHRIPALPASNVQNPSIFALKLVEKINKHMGRFPQSVWCLTI